MFDSERCFWHSSKESTKTPGLFENGEDRKDFKKENELFYNSCPYRHNKHRGG